MPNVRKLYLQFLKNGVKELWAGGRQRRMVQAQSLLCYWGTREYRMRAVSISTKLNIASSTACEFAMRARQIVEGNRWKLLVVGDVETNPTYLCYTGGHCLYMRCETEFDRGAQ